MLLSLFFTGAGRYLSADYWIDRRLNRDSNRLSTLKDPMASSLSI
jgi:hypothetical protein